MPYSRMDKNDAETLAFQEISKFNQWLSENQDKKEGIWLRFYKKSSKIPTITHAEALDEALCFGWIDAQAKKYDEKSWIQKFTPRRTRSIWSKRNIEHVERLIKENKMKPQGLKQVELAKKDGRWEKAYDSPSNMKIPEDFLKELSKNPKAKEFFKNLNKTNIYSITWRLQTAVKKETREKRMKKIIEMLNNEEKFH